MLDDNGKELTDAQLRKLRIKWYKKLKKAGFNDIEYPCTKWEGHALGDRIKHDTSDLMRKFGFLEKGEPTVVLWQAIRRFQRAAEYYCYARSFANTYKFPTDKDRRIWTLHADAVSYRNIASRIGSTNYDAVSRCVQKYQRILLEEIGERERGSAADNEGWSSTGHVISGRGTGSSGELRHIEDRHTPGKVPFDTQLRA